MEISKIFCIGLSRTGTTALHEIFLQLDLKSKHYVGELISADNWEILDEYAAVGDAPVPLIYKQLDRRYPNSKFILTTRDKSQWLSSMKWMFRHGRVIWNWTPELGNYHQKLYGCNRYNTKVLANAFDKYHENVSNYFKERPTDLLKINIDNGFDIETMCKFLEIPAKEVQVAHHSDRREATALEFVKYYLRTSIIRPIKRLTRSSAK